MPSPETAAVTINRQRLLDRFLRYVRVETTADPECDDYPSSRGQRELATMLAEELRGMGADDVELDEHSLVWATIPATEPGELPMVALVAHLDTSPEADGRDVRPQVVDRYEGGDIALPGGPPIRVDSSPTLGEIVGKTLITTDGTTLLGGDDKAGVAIIMELAQTLIERPHLSRGPIRLLFTCDEEIGRGTDKIDLGKLDATVAYTLDGGGRGVIDVETFSADAATVRFTGHNIHPAIAKDRMVNAVRVAADFVAALPRDRHTPETTDGREGFVHPHTIRGGVGEASVELLLRSFDAERLEDDAAMLRRTAESVAARTPGVGFEVNVRKQYRNMRDGLAKLPEAVTLAEEAFKRLDRSCSRAIIRGGTDGSQLTEKGLPTPNLSSGQHNIHSVTEFACLDEMAEAAQHLVVLLELWGRRKA